jgi:hypothetical protein
MQKMFQIKSFNEMYILHNAPNSYTIKPILRKIMKRSLSLMYCKVWEIMDTNELKLSSPTNS